MLAGDRSLRSGVVSVWSVRIREGREFMILGKEMGLGIPILSFFDISSSSSGSISDSFVDISFILTF